MQRQGTTRLLEEGRNPKEEKQFVLVFPSQKKRKLLDSLDF